jgi:multiple sugar transport system substrate-binding protein
VQRATRCALLVVLLGCGRGRAEPGTVITFSGSALGAEGAVLARHITRFMQANPGIRVKVQPTPDDATQRHQLFVQWLNARAGDPDVLQLDVVWTAEFAAAEWILPLTRWRPEVSAFYPATVTANTWAGALYALPWWVDVGMLYWRTDLLARAPMSMAELADDAHRARSAGIPYGIVWQGARYEGLVTVFLEYLGGFGGRVLADDGRVIVDSPEAVRALNFMRDLVRDGSSPQDVLTWHEEESRFAFQNGTAVMMRNWPYAYGVMGDARTSRVAGKFAAVPMPAAPGGVPTATLGGSELAINAYTEHPDAAYRLIAFLTAPEQMLERATVGGYPARPALYGDPRLRSALPIPAAEARAILERATPRPVTPIYSQLSELLQIQLHRALTGQAEPAAALTEAAARMNALVERTRVRELTAQKSAR